MALSVPRTLVGPEERLSRRRIEARGCERTRDNRGSLGTEEGQRAAENVCTRFDKSEQAGNETLPPSLSLSF